MLIDNASTVQIVMYVVFAVVVVVAIMWGAKRVKLKLPGIEASVDPDEKRTVTVAREAQFQDAKIGNVTGERRSGAGGPAARDVDVLSGGVIKGGSVGDITGVDESGAGAGEKK